MAKLTIDERIVKINSAIEKETAAIFASKEKVKALQKELKTLTEEKNRSYANDFLEIISANGFITDEQKKQFLELCAREAKNAKDNSEKINTREISNEMAGTGCHSIKNT